jgi:hypothetical protein
MIDCGVTTGFFVLRRCGAPPVTVCARCRRPLCQTHVAEGGLCPECAAAQGPSAHPAAATAHHRRSFYHTTSRGFRDATFYSSLDAFDRAAFDPHASANDDYDADDGPDGDLVDS